MLNNQLVHILEDNLSTLSFGAQYFVFLFATSKNTNIFFIQKCNVSFFMGVKRGVSQ
jgi:hypothetical protein